MSLLLLALAGTLAACGGGGGGGATETVPAGPTVPPVASTSTVLSGTVSAGIVSNADLQVFDATTYTGVLTSQAIASATTAADGSYEVTLPAGYDKAVLIRVSGKADGSSSVKDEVFGTTPITGAFVLESVVPGSHVGPAGGKVTVHVTAYTHAMAAYVSNKLGKADIEDSAISARIHVGSKLTGGADPLTTVPSRPAMVVLLAAASNIANTPVSNFASDPYGCAVKSSNEAKITCTLQTISGILQPLASTTAATASPALNLRYATVLSGAAKSLDLGVVAANTGVANAELATAQATAVTDLDKTETAALAGAGDGDGALAALPLIGVTKDKGGSLIIASGPDAGVYQGWNYALTWCLGAGSCPVDFDVRASITPQDVLEDPELEANVETAVAELVKEIVTIQRAIYALGRTAYPSAATFARVISDAVRQGLAAGSVGTAAAAARSGLSAAGFPVDAPATKPDDAEVPTATSDQLAAAKACVLPEAYVNPTATPFNPQLDSNCRLAQVNACFHRAGITAYDAQGRAACNIVNGLIKTLPGTWRCGYCSPAYPF